MPTCIRPSPSSAPAARPSSPPRSSFSARSSGRLRGVARLRVEVPMHLVELRVWLAGASDCREVRREPLVEEALPVLLRLPDVDDPHGVALPPDDMEDPVARGFVLPVG